MPVTFNYLGGCDHFVWFTFIASEAVACEGAEHENLTYVFSQKKTKIRMALQLVRFLDLEARFIAIALGGCCLPSGKLIN